MQVVNIKDWYSGGQVMALAGFKYHMQLWRWRKANNIVFTPLCNITLYLRESVDYALRRGPDVYVWTWDDELKNYKNINYKALVDLNKRILATPAFDIDLGEWQPYCYLENNPHPMILSRLSNQQSMPQVRTKVAYGLKFYHIGDIQREFKKWIQDTG